MRIPITSDSRSKSSFTHFCDLQFRAKLQSSSSSLAVLVAESRSSAIGIEPTKQHKMSTRSSKRKRTSSSRTGTATPQAPRPRTHAFTGCGNCRDRHVKCDLGTPNCLNCSRLKLNCEGYSRKYQWIPSKFSEKGRCIPTTLPVDDAEETQTSRRVLFSG